MSISLTHAQLWVSLYQPLRQLLTRQEMSVEYNTSAMFTLIFFIVFKSMIFWKKRWQYILNTPFDV